MKTVKRMCDVTRSDRIKNEYTMVYIYVYKNFYYSDVTNTVGKVRENKLRKFVRVNCEENRGNSRPMKEWLEVIGEGTRVCGADE